MTRARCLGPATTLVLLPLLAMPWVRPAVAQAQQPVASTSGAAGATGTALARATLDCPGGTGVWISGLSPETGGERHTLLLDTPVDTTIVFAVPRVSWSRAWFTGLVAAGIASGGTRGAPARPPAGTAEGPWSVCLGVAVHMERPTLTILNARGRVRLRADLRDLASRAPQVQAADSVPLPIDPRR